jgi:hypothetical protein
MQSKLIKRGRSNELKPSYIFIFVLHKSSDKDPTIVPTLFLTFAKVTRISMPAIILALLLAQSSGSFLLPRQIDNSDAPDPDYLKQTHYLDSMCTPNFPPIDIDPDLLSSSLDLPFPCEVREAILADCLANGTSEIDRLAEQECLCGGALWDVWKGCDDCYFVHGVAIFDPADADAFRPSVSIAECSPTAPLQEFNLLTATETALTLGPITGSATAGQYGHGGICSATDISTIMTESSTTGGRTLSITPMKITSSPSPSASKNVATMGKGPVSSGLLTFLVATVVLI